MLKKGVGRNSLNIYLSFWRVPSESIFSFTGWRNYIYIYIYRSFPRFPPLFQPESWHETRPICSQRHLSSKLIFFTPISADGRKCHFRSRALANHLAFFLPFLGDSLRLLSLSSGHRVQTSVGFHSDLDLLLRPRGIDLDSYSSLNGHSLAAC